MEQQLWPMGHDVNGEERAVKSEVPDYLGHPFGSQSREVDS